MEEPKVIAERILANVERVIIGKTEAVRLALIALMCQGHVLIEDVPGVGKTVLARSLAASTGCSFRRIQFTPDLLPSDVTGVSIYSQKSGDFEFRAGPIMAQVVLADEINRARALREQLPAVEGIDLLAEAYVRERFGRSRPDAAEHARLEQAWRSVRNGLLRRVVNPRS